MKFPDFSLTSIANYKIPWLATKFLDFFPWLWESLESPWLFPDHGNPVFASFHHHTWIQTAVMVRKLLNWVLTMTFDLWPWSFAWTSLLSTVIIPENFMTIWWCEHCDKGVTDERTDGQTDWTSHSAAWSQLKRPLVFAHRVGYTFRKVTQRVSKIDMNWTHFFIIQLSSTICHNH